MNQYQYQEQKYTPKGYCHQDIQEKSGEDPMSLPELTGLSSGTAYPQQLMVVFQKRYLLQGTNCQQQCQGQK